MKKIFINDGLLRIASDYSCELSAFLVDNKRLKKLKDELDGQYKLYVEKIISEWENLVVLQPSDFESVHSSFCMILSDNQLSGIIGGKPFYKRIIDAMGYKDVQSKIFPKYMAKLNINTCIYCNAQYAYAANYGKDVYVNYELDHWKPKSIYPFLCTSFFNLQPCCSKCNKLKSNKDAKFSLYTKNEDDIDPMHFSLSEDGIIKYYATRDINMIRIIFDCPGNSELKDNHEKLFHITTLYQGHRDIVEEILWKKQIYNSTFQEIYFQQFKKLGFTPSMFKRFILSNYSGVEEINKCPLSKMIQDIARELNLI